MDDLAPLWTEFHGRLVADPRLLEVPEIREHLAAVHTGLLDVMAAMRQPWERVEIAAGADPDDARRRAGRRVGRRPVNSRRTRAA